MITFEWNPTKATANQKKHGVSFEEAQSISDDEYAVQFFDDDSQEDGDRFLILGLSSETKLLMVCHCERYDGGIFELFQPGKLPN